MKVPLIAAVNNQDGMTRLDIWTNGKKLNVAAPFRPYIFSKHNLGDIKGTASWKEVKKSLSTLQEEEYWCYELEKTTQVYDIKRDWEESVGPLNFAEASMPFVHRVLVDEPEWYKQFPNTDELRVLHVDVEQWFDKSFPTHEDPIIAIGLGYGKDKREVLMVKEVTPEEERRILDEFVERLVDYDPDLIVGYNILGYDIPVMFKRLCANGMYPHVFGREGDTLFDEEGPQIEGRLLYDLYHSVEKDQTLHGIKNRKMKTVAKWFKLDGVVDMPEQSFKHLVGTETLRGYNESDINISQQLFEIYFPKIEGMAEYLGCPLGELIPFADAFPATIQQARILRKKNIVSDGMNRDRYPQIFRTHTDDDGEETRLKFEGASVELFKRGWFRDVYKYDFGSMYPHIMWSIGIGPDNTTLVTTNPYGPFKCWREGSIRYYSVPDKNFNVNFLIKVEGESDVANFIKELLKQRLELKKEAKRLEEAGQWKEFEKVESQQYALKVVLNSVYGQNGAGFLRYGSGPVAVMVTCIGRQLISFLKDMAGDGAIEIDTDGLYTDRRYSLDKIVDQLNFYTMFELLGEPVMKVDEDVYVGGWFHRAKNYLLLKKDKKTGKVYMVKHGGAFKGTKLPPLFDQIIDRVGLLLLVKGPQEALREARKCLDLSQYGPEDFVQQIRLQKDPEGYASQSNLSMQVALDAQAKTGLVPKVGNHYRYVKTVRGYEMFDMEAFSRLDTEYYTGTIEDALGLLGFEPAQLRNRSLMEF